jgi:hypothetical protein
VLVQVVGVFDALVRRFWHKHRINTTDHANDARDLAIARVFPAAASLPRS